MSRLDEMLRIAQAATKGPWRAEDDSTLVWGACNSADLPISGMGYPIVYCHTLPSTYANKPTEDDGLANAQHIATFNPRTAEALVKVALALKPFADYEREYSDMPHSNDMVILRNAGGNITVGSFRTALKAFSALTAAMED